ncbi:MAG TPA: hypothetical protein VLG25_03345 [Patescibacteria group bacterium]|nr:hypothetical protein [Patescibacteria group bacterium]
MIDWLILTGAALIFCFGFVVAFGAPYLPTLSPQVKTSLELLNLKPGQTLLELGCGGGNILIAAAKQDLFVVGYELNPILALVAWLRTRRYSGRVRVVWGNFWTKKWPPADGIFVFGIDNYMKRLHKKITQQFNKPVKLVSFAFKIPGKKQTAQKDGLYLYQY